MIIVLSDVHLGYEKSDIVNFNDFINKYVSQNLNSKDHLVLLGDIFDFWRRKNMDPLLENQNVLTKILDLNTNVHFVIGNHDYYMLKIKERYPEYYALNLCRYLRLKSGKSNFFFIHGYELDVLANYEPLTIEDYEIICEALCRAENVLGRLMSMIWGLRKKLKKPPNQRRSWRIKGGIVNHMNNLEALACSKVRNFFLGMGRSEKLVFGHTHHPFLFEDTANTGSWVKEEYEYNTFIKIDNGKMELNKWDGEVKSLN